MNKSKKVKKSVKNKVIKCLICLALIGATVYFWTQINKEVSTTFSLLADLNSSKQELEKLKAEKQHLEAEKEKLTDENYVSSVARGKYLITKDDEQIYELPSVESGQ
ncbi:MAG: septum formation initiator family protein [Erysipelotrichia bacterium]|nr:septum formation initiator family protein [Erysipelotrichia bacterium]